MTDEEKLAKGWVYSCKTGELVNPYERMPMVMQMLDKIGDHEIVGGLYKCYSDKVSGVDGVAIGRPALSMTEQLMIDGYDIHVSLDPASDTPNIVVWKEYKNGVVRIIDKDKVIQNFNFNDPKIIKMLEKKDDV